MPTPFTNTDGLEAVVRRYGCKDPQRCLRDGYHLAEYSKAAYSVMQPQPRPTIVCLCGSTKFFDAFQQANYDETMQGKIVLSVGFFPQSPDKNVVRDAVDIGTNAHPTQAKVKLDELHKRKIDLADEILVLNVGGYIGPSTESEINYARQHDKVVRYLEQ